MNLPSSIFPSAILSRMIFFFWTAYIEYDNHLKRKKKNHEASVVFIYWQKHCNCETRDRYSLVEMMLREAYSLPLCLSLCYENFDYRFRVSNDEIQRQLNDLARRSTACKDTHTGNSRFATQTKVHIQRWIEERRKRRKLVG